MNKVLLQATLLISACFANKYHPDQYYAVVDNQPFASYITEFYNGIYIVEGTYQKNVQAIVYNKYVRYYSSIHEDNDRKSFNYTRKGVRTNSQFGQNLTFEY
ncbi:hypothetical protein ABPG74_005189 [Tetrahymena malaccensis]